MNNKELHDRWSVETDDSDVIEEEKRKVIQEVMHDDINSEELT